MAYIRLVTRKVFDDEHNECDEDNDDDGVDDDEDLDEVDDAYDGNGQMIGDVCSKNYKS